MQAAQANHVIRSDDPQAIRLLVFPLDLDTAKSFVNRAKALNLYVIGASSVMNDPNAADVDDFVHLPYVTAPEFDQSFERLITTQNITHIYAPHSGVWNHLNQIQQSNPEQFYLCTPTPFEADWLEYAPSYSWQQQMNDERLLQALDSSKQPRDRLDSAQYVGLHKQFCSIPGQCDDNKLSSLIDIMRVVPEGDIVEIGSLYGRSAYALGFLADKHRIGNVISIDPWRFGKIKPQGDAAKLLNKQIGEADPEKVFKVFIANAVLLNNLGYIRATSEEASHLYHAAAKERSLSSPHLGRIAITGKISLLHIDGNHKYEEVCKDIKNWVPLVKTGGWVLLDDYVWAFGDGPKQAGDELIQSDGFDLCFCLGDTLFLRRSTASVNP